jgi:hypothetical protein
MAAFLDTKLDFCLQAEVRSSLDLAIWQFS